MTLSYTRRTLELVIAPVTPVLTVAELKDHLRVDLNDDDALIEGYGAAAQLVIENATRRKLVEQTWRLNIRDGFDPDELGRVWIPHAPLSSVTSIKYLDTSGVEQTWSDTEYEVVKPIGPQALAGNIELAFEETFPDVREAWNSVRIEFVAGYGDNSPDDVPEGLKSAIKLLVGTYYESRESVIVGTIGQELPKVVENLIAPFRAEL